MEKLKSRKFWAAVAGVIFAGLAAQYPDYREVITQVSMILIAYIGGEAYVDGKRESAKGGETVRSLDIGDGG